MDKQLSVNGFSDVQSAASTRAPREGGKFVNHQPVPPNGILKVLGIMTRYITEPQVDKEPEKTLPVQTVTAEMLSTLSNNTVHIVKLGHSTILMKVMGEYWLFDPVFSERASPFSFMGPKRFHQPPISIADLPDIDKVFISHNHYDHLDKASVKALAAKTRQFLVPLGVDKEVINWGVAESDIKTFDWWQEMETGQGKVVFTPTRHFSGRGLSDANTTLWGSWVIQTDVGSIYFSGDSGYFDGFKQIGDKYGPFDLTMIETGAYDHDWPDIHMQPEESLQAHLDLRGKVMVPVHNGTFDLAFHSWYEPLEKITALADAKEVVLSTPQFGQVMSMENLYEPARWWRSVM